MALGADSERSGTVRRAQNLESLRLHLLLFAVDVGNNVVEDVERRDPRIPRARNRLKRRHDQPLDAEGAVERGGRQRQTDGGAVRVRDDEPAATPCTLLRLDQLEVVDVQFRDEARTPEI